MKVGDQAQARGDDAGNGGHQEDLVECGTTSLVGGEDEPRVHHDTVRLVTMPGLSLLCQ